MTRPTVSIFDVTTQEEIIREMNDEEYSQYLLDIQAADARASEESAKQLEIDAAKVAVEEKLSALGLDLETIKLIAKI